ncbi:MAG: polysaccharide pyruvyl transferase family protein [Lachnospiraceae bacterium]|nr:polysaccharide pyruvyl transferase family protein [Candidatus Colinaster equi]
MDEIVLSIIMPVYNDREYLEDSINSVFNQSLMGIELICIDDGSTDGSYEYIVEESQKHQNMVCLRQCHNGSGTARNKGIEVARGKYVAFLDADDMYYDNVALELMVMMCEKHNVSICAGYRKEMYDNHVVNGHFLDGFVIKNAEGTLIKFEQFQNDYDFQNFIFAKSVIVTNEIRFPNYLRYQDPPFLLEMLVTCGEFWLVPNYVYCYRVGQFPYSKLVEYVNYVLMGIKDTLKVAIENDYRILYERIIARLNRDYYSAILDGNNDEVSLLLEEIEGLNRTYSNHTRIAVYDVIQKQLMLRDLWGDELAREELVSNYSADFSIYRHIARISMFGKTLVDMFEKFEIKKVSIYGYGEIGQLVINCIWGKVQILHIYDRNRCGEETKHGIIENPDDIDVNDNEIIVITPANAVQSISFDLIQHGVSRKRIYAIDTLLSIFDSNEYCDNGLVSKRQFLITGAQFQNKGAQAMLFVTMHEIRKRFPDAIIWYLPVDYNMRYSTELKEKYRLLFLTDGYQLRSQLFAIANNLDAIIDVSGYALSSYWNNEWYITNLRIAQNYEIPMYIMPQSFGPFDYDIEKVDEIKHLLSNMKAIYARERNGYELLTKELGLNNVYESNDLVLQCGSVDLNNIFTNIVTQSISKIETNSVAVIPNVRICEFSSTGYALSLYKRIIDELLLLGKNIYVVPHSDDLVLCKQIINNYINKEEVQIVGEEMDCIQFKAYISQFDYVISSRFHAIVHSCKMRVPCIAIGWEEKYVSLMHVLEQEDMCFDTFSDIKLVLSAIHVMENEYKSRKEIISKAISEIEKANCFDVLNNME